MATNVNAMEGSSLMSKQGRQIAPHPPWSRNTHSTSSDKDPFASLRNEPSPFAVGDVDDDDATPGAFTEDQAKSLYHEYAYDEDISGQSSSFQLSQDWRFLWFSILSRLLAEDTNFQQAVLNNRLSEGLYNFEYLRLNDSWLVGLYLPGCYQFFDDLESLTEYLYDGSQWMSEVVAPAMKAVEGAKKNHAERAVEAERYNAVGGVVPASLRDPSPSVATFFALAQNEKTTNVSRANVAKVLKDLAPLLTNPESATLKEMYGSNGSHAAQQRSLVDRFGDATFDKLRTLSKLTRNMSHRPRDLEPDPALEAIMQETEAFEDAVDEDMVEDDESGGIAQDITINIKGAPSIVESFEAVPELQIVNKAIRMITEKDSAKIWFYPFWQRPSEGLFRFEQSQETKEPAESDQTDPPLEGGSAEKSVFKIARRSTSFITSREISLEEWKDAKGGRLDTKASVMAEAIKSFMGDIDAHDAYALEEYDAGLQELMAVVTRSPAAAVAAHDYTGFRTFSRTQLLDDWWHVRKYLQAVDYYLAANSLSALDKKHELDLLMILGVVQNGLRDPLPVVLLLDYSLRQLWREILKKQPEPSSTLSMLFSEITVFAYGAAINGVVLRSKRSAHSSDQIKSIWYPSLIAWNPRCANVDCNLNLPQSQTLTTHDARALFSIGTRQARIGHKALRSMISTNRDFAFPCLWEIITCWAPDKTLIILIFWFSHVYHNKACKAHRGKTAITAF